MKMAPPLNYNDLQRHWRKGMRNGNWRKLNPHAKCFFRAAIWYAKAMGEIVSTPVVVKLMRLIEILAETHGMRIYKRGFEKAGELLEKGENVFVWAPSLKAWLKDPDYIFWLGTAAR
jgi:hypothetical protein